MKNLNERRFIKGNPLDDIEVMKIYNNFKRTKNIKVGDVFDVMAISQHLHNDSFRICKETRAVEYGTYVIFGNKENFSEVSKNIKDFAKWYEYEYPELSEEYKGLIWLKKMQ